MKLLYLVHRVPYPPNRGDRIRSYHLLRFLAARSEVHLACLADEQVTGDTRAELDRLCGRVAIEPLGNRRRWFAAAGSLLNGGSATEGLFSSPALQRTVATWSAEARYDAVCMFCSSMAAYVDHPGLTNVPLVVDLVDVDSQKWFDYAQRARFPVRTLFALEGGRVQRLEGMLAERAQAMTVVSESEAGLLRRFCPDGRVHAVPNGVDLEYFRPQESDEATVPGRCLFVGALDYRANIDGVTWFVSEVWNSVRQLMPAATLAIVGRNPVAAVRRLAQYPGVDVVGSVPDVRPYLHQASVVVAPLRIARGVQNKVLEAAAAARPVVASPEALEGLGLTTNVEVLSAATPQEWAAAVTSLLKSREERSRLGRAARRHVEQRHDWNQCLSPFADLLGLCPEGFVSPRLSAAGAGTENGGLTSRRELAGAGDEC